MTKCGPWYTWELSYSERICHLKGFPKGKNTQLGASLWDVTDITSQPVTGA